MSDRTQLETLGIFPDVETASGAVENLVRAGFAEEKITSITSVPYPDGVLVTTGRKTWFRWAALAGGVIGAFAGFLLAAGTAWVYPIQTGDKPIITFYPTGVITFELAMLFAISGAIIGMFIEMRLPPRGNRVYDPAIAEGFIGISVSDASEALRRRSGEIMRENGAIRIVTEESSERM